MSRAIAGWKWSCAELIHTISRTKVPCASSTAQETPFRRWSHGGDGWRLQLSVDNNHIENQIRLIAIGRSSWLFAGSLRSGKRAVAVMGLIQSAKVNGHDPYRL
jgi:hypothetical protein